MSTLKVSLISVAVTGLMAVSTANAWTTISPVTFSAAKDTNVMRVRSKSFSDPSFGNQAWAMHGSWGVFNAVKGNTYTITVSPSAVDASGKPVNYKDASGNPISANGLHPALAVWKRPESYTYTDASGNAVTLNNLTLAKYVPDHNFFPAQSYIESGYSQDHNQGAWGGSCTDSATKTCATMTKTIGGTSVTAKVAEFWNQARRATPVNSATVPVLLEDGTTDIGFPRMLLVSAAYDADKSSPIYNKLDMNPAVKAKKGDGSGTVQMQFVADETVQYEFFVGAMNPDVGHTVSFFNEKVVVSGF